MAQFELSAEPREAIGKQVKYLRQEGWVPAVLYGRGIEAQPIKVEGVALRQVLQQAGMNQLISLKVGRRKAVPVLARDVQRATLKHNLLHVDFQQVVMTEKITTEVPVHLIGEAPAAKREGVLVQGLDTLTIECLPGDLMSVLEVDISHLDDYNAAVLVSDLTLPDTVTVLSDPDSLIAKVEPPRKVEEVEAVEEPVEAEEVEPDAARAVEEEAEEE